MATSCCCRRRQQAESVSSRRATRITTQDLPSEAPEAVHQDHRQKSLCCGDTRVVAAGAVGRERQRSRPLYGRQGVAVMQPTQRPTCCLLESRKTTRGEHVPSASFGRHSPSRLCGAPISVSCLSNWQMPSLVEIATSLQTSNFKKHNRKHNQYLLGAQLARTCLLVTTIYLMLIAPDGRLTSASLMSAITNGANSVSNQQPGTGTHNMPKAAAASPGDSFSLEGSSKLARQILASHYQNQLMSHIQSRQTAKHEQQLRQPHHQATTATTTTTSSSNAAWPQYEDAYGAHQHGVHQMHPQHDAAAPSSDLSLWSISAGEQQAARNHPEPPVNQPRHVGGPSSPTLQLAQPTTPTLNKQLAPPPPFYDFGQLMPTNVLQLETVPAHQQGGTGGGYDQALQHHATSPMASVIPSDMHRHHHREQSQMMQAAESAVAAQLARMPAAHNSSSSGSRDSRAMATMDETLGKSSDQQQDGDQASQDNQGGVSSSNSQNSDSKFDNNNHDQQQQQQQQSGPVDKGIEPRQRRRMFNRILKKAEWNHLFVELSKVFLRYFLDLALKDIIGKQSGALGSSSSSSSGDSTTGRKKLDAQSELADMLKEFVKTAISNLR